MAPEGEIVKDLTLGEYDIIVTSQPERDTLEDSTFAQAAEMRKDLGVNIPDSVLIQSSRLPDKAKVLEAIDAQTNGPEAQQSRQLDLQQRQAEIGKLVADTERDKSETQVKLIKAQQDALTAARPIPPEAQLRVEADLASKKYEIDTHAQLQREKMANDVHIAGLKSKQPKKGAKK